MRKFCGGPYGDKVKLSPLDFSAPRSRARSRGRRQGIMPALHTLVYDRRGTF